MNKVKAPLENCIKFFVNEEKRTVVCIIDTVAYETPFDDNHYPEIKKVVVKGTAKCSKEDKFDITIGKRIAESRAKVELFRKLRDISLDLSYEMRKACDDYGNQAHKYSVLIDREKEHIKTLTK